MSLGPVPYLLLLSYALQGHSSSSQETTFLETERGTLPLILSAPHGGRGTTPEGWPEPGTRPRDGNTWEIVWALADALEERTGHRPWVVALSIHPANIEMNVQRESSGSGIAGENPHLGRVAHWEGYHAFLEEAGEGAVKAGGGGALLVDIHGHAHSHGLAELGYGMSASELAKPDDELPRADWYRGPRSLGTRLEEVGIPAVPSLTHPHPDGLRYFTGGYIIRRHRSGTEEGLQSVQIELPPFPRFSGTDGERALLVEGMADALVQFMADHFTLPLPPFEGFEVIDIPTMGRLAPFREAFFTVVEVFGIPVVATEGVSAAKQEHAAHVLAQWLDNDEDGIPDDTQVMNALHAEGAFLVMVPEERDMENLFGRGIPETLEEAGWRLGQDLHGEEAFPDGPPHSLESRRFDATLEEVLHLVSNGWVEAYPEAFGLDSRAPSLLTQAMDRARGGRFLLIPWLGYPRRAWYTYSDRTCDYACQGGEYLYWGLTSLLGAQEYAGRPAEIGDEWRCPAAATFALCDPDLHALLTNPRYNLPTVLPDGTYR